MRARVLVAVAAAALPPGASRAEPRLEASGFVGVDWFGARTALGNSWAPEQVPGTAPVVGGRIGWLALPALPGRLQLALEAELAFAPAFTGDSAGHGRMAYFAPVLEWRGQALLRLARWRVAPHLVLGAGGDSVASHSPFIARDTDPIAYWGAGLSAPLGRWQLRFDVHHGVMPARDGGAASTVELELGIGMALGTGAVRRAPAVESVEAVRPVEPVERDPSTAAHACVDARGNADTCAPADPDGDGVVGDADRCPDQPEDLDGFQDADGCPDPDNDRDGIADADDACPDAAETVNGWQDDDGCPDELPGELTAALATVVPFEPGHARVTEAAGATLRTLRELLDRYPELRIAIIGHPERAGDDDLAHRRAEAVKWYLVDQGIPEDRLIAGMSASVASPPVAFQLIPAPHRPP